MVKKYVCIPRSFLVINVCNQGKNLCSPCILGPKWEEVTGEWSRLHTGELCDLYCSPNVIREIKSRKMRWAGYVACMGDRRGAYKDLVGKPEGK